MRKVINRFAFPDGARETSGNVQREMERSRFEILEMEGLRPYYALRLRSWLSWLQAHRDVARTTI